jgi:hypothetical protein
MENHVEYFQHLAPADNEEDSVRSKYVDSYKEFMEYYETGVVAAWRACLDSLKELDMDFAVMDRMKYEDFARFVYNNSSGKRY